jgi:hypothetical protein
MPALPAPSPSRPSERVAGRVALLACQLAVVVIYPLSRIRLLLRAYGSRGTDVDAYFEYARRAIAGETPYRDFPVEYPPGAWLLIRAPATNDWTTYAYRLAWIGTALEIAAFGVFLLVARKAAPRQFWILGATYVVLTTPLRGLFATRLDTGLLLLLMVWVWLRLDLPDGPAAGKRAISYGVLGFATSFKLFPIVMLPFVLAHDWRHARDPVRWSPLAWFVIGAGLPFAVLWPSAGLSPFGFLRYHLARGLEIESVWATVAWPSRWLGAAIRPTLVQHAVELAGRWPSALAQFSTVAAVGAVAACFAAERARPWRGSVVVAATIGLAAFVTASKVLSPQYFLWMLPMLLLAGSDVIRADRTFWWWCGGVMVVAALTSLIYPTFFLAVFEMRPAGFALLLARNSLFVALIVALGRRVWTA